MVFSVSLSEQLNMLYRMVEIRLFEDEIQRLFTKNLVRGSTHLCNGQEACVVGACAALRAGDTMVCTYRGHGAVLAMGAPMPATFGEILGRRNGLCGGKGGSMHLTDTSVGAYGSFAIVGAHLPVAAGLALAGSAFAGSLASLLVVFLLAQRGGRLLGSGLVLAGMAIAYFGTALTGYLQLQADPSELRGVLFWMLGSVAGASWPALTVPVLVTAVCALVLTIHARPMNALATGDDTAAGLGVGVNQLRILLLVASSVLTAAVVSSAGGIGFVGLIVPHAVRLVVGPDHRKVIPVALLSGAVFLVVVDLVTRIVNRPNEMPIGICTAALGAPLFLVLLRGRKRVLR